MVRAVLVGALVLVAGAGAASAQPHRYGPGYGGLVVLAPPIILDLSGRPPPPPPPVVYVTPAPQVRACTPFQVQVQVDGVSRPVQGQACSFTDGTVRIVP